MKLIKSTDNTVLVDFTPAEFQIFDALVQRAEKYSYQTHDVTTENINALKNALAQQVDSQKEFSFNKESFMSFAYLFGEFFCDLECSSEYISLIGSDELTKFLEEYQEIQDASWTSSEVRLYLNKVHGVISELER